MKEESVRDFVFVLYLLVILLLTVVYSTVPEREVFLSNTLDWWSSALDMIM